MLNSDTYKENLTSTKSSEEIEKIDEFYRQHKRNFYINKNKNKPKYSLKEVDGVVETFDNKIPKLVVCIFNRRTKETIYRELIPKEEVNNILVTIHCVNVGDLQTCQPCSENKLTKMFNDKYYFFGLQKVVSKFLKNCQTCKLNNTLPQTIPSPPIPIRTFYPYQRLQFDLIYISSRKRQYLKENRWGFQYVLSVKCTFSKYIWLFPLKERDSSSVYQLLRFLCEKEGFPEIFQSDNGSEFVATVISINITSLVFRKL